MRNTTCKVLIFIVTQVGFSLAISPVFAASKGTNKAAPSKSATKTKPKTSPKIAPRTSATAPPKESDPFARLTPYNNGFGVMISEPVADGVDEETAKWGAGATRWLDFVVGGQGELGRNPALSDELLVSQDLKRSDLRLTEKDAAQLVRILGLTHAVTSKISADGDQISLTLQLLKIEKEKPATPLGDAIYLKGTRETISGALPDAARQIAQKLGVKAPRVPEKLELTPADFILLGTVPLNSWEPLADDKQTALTQLAERETLAALLALRKADIPKMTRLIMRRDSDNIRALSVLSRQGGNQMETYVDEWQPVVKQFPQNYQATYIQFFQAQWNKNWKSSRQVAENMVRAAPYNSVAWYRLAQSISDNANETRNSRFMSAMTETEVNVVMQQYPLWQAAAQRAVRLNPQDGEAWLGLSQAATFNGDPIAEKAFWTAQKLIPDSVDVYYWGTEMFQPKWGGDPEQMLKIAEVMTDNKNVNKQLLRYIAKALNYVNLKDARARKAMNFYLESAANSAKATPELLAAWQELQKDPLQVSRWRKVAEEASEAADKVRMGRASAELSKAEVSTVDNFYNFWLIAANYGATLNPLDSQIWVEYARASSFASRNTLLRPSEAIEQAIQLDPQNVEAYRWGLQMYQPKWSNAPEDLAEMIQKSAANKALFDVLAPDIAEALNTITQKTPAQVALLNKANEQITELEKREEAKVQKRLGAYFRSTRQYPRAAAAFKNWARLEPDNADAHFRYAGVLHNMAKFDEALTEYGEALRIDKDHVQSLLWAGEILVYQRKFSEAETLLRHATEILPQWPKAFVKLGEALNGQNKRAEARAAWEKAVSFGEDYDGQNEDIATAKSLLAKFPAEP